MIRSALLFLKTAAVWILLPVGVQEEQSRLYQLHWPSRVYCWRGCYRCAWRGSRGTSWTERVVAQQARSRRAAYRLVLKRGRCPELVCGITECLWLVRRIRDTPRIVDIPCPIQIRAQVYQLRRQVRHKGVLQSRILILLKDVSCSEIGEIAGVFGNPVNELSGDPALSAIRTFAL